MGLNCYNSPNVTGASILDGMANDNDNSSDIKWNPYDITKPVKWYNFLANTLSDMLGFQVDYHRTDPDSGGIDKVVF